MTNMDQTLGLLLIGLVAGIMAGMFGLGGGAVMVPALMLFLGLSQTQANGTSLVVLALPVGIFGCIEYYRKGKLKIRVALAVGLGIACGSWLGAGIALDLPERVLAVLYGLFLLYMAWRYIAPRLWLRERRGETLPPPPETTPTDLNALRTLAVCFVIGFVAGITAGMFGLGGGTIVVTGLMILLSFDQKLANGTSLGALLLPTGLPAAIRYYLAGKVDLSVVVPLALMLALGALGGARLSLGLPEKTVRRAFGVFLLLIGLRFILGA
jgi:uncharacterized membrane protein YfcA